MVGENRKNVTMVSIMARVILVVIPAMRMEVVIHRYVNRSMLVD